MTMLRNDSAFIAAAAARLVARDLLGQPPDGEAAASWFMPGAGA